MNRERNLIKSISNNMPRSSMQINKLFESDSEIISFNGLNLCHSIDEFSEEDMLRENDPYSLGWNVGVGSITDILASGGTPKFYSHSLTIDELWSDEFVNRFTIGISDVLREMKIDFIGGDFGISKTWRYTGSVYGIIEDNILLRSKAIPKSSIYITGKVGKGNIEAAYKIYSDKIALKQFLSKIKNKFNLRYKESKLIRKYSHCCMDTSDGVYNCIKTIANESNCGFYLDNIQYESIGSVLSKMVYLPIEILFLGECGEYELVFTIMEKKEKMFLEEAKNNRLNFYKIGEIKEKGVRKLKTKKREINLLDLEISARDFSNKVEYIKKLNEFLKDG
ncbi:MAG: AIR synthase related protein [Clostridiales bacterium]